MPAVPAPIVVRRLLLGGVWLGISLAFLRLFLGSTRPHSVDLHPLLAVAALGSLVAAVAAGTWPRTARIHGLAGLTVMAAAAVLLLAGTAHETGLVLGGLGALAALVALWPPPRD